jgi:hypothetical protein
MYYNGAPRPNWQIGNGLNYFGISVLTSIGNDGSVQSNPGLTVAQTLSIDTKVDDGLPMTGTVTASYLNTNAYVWAGSSNTNAMSKSTTALA